MFSSFTGKETKQEIKNNELYEEENNKVKTQVKLFVKVFEIENKETCWIKYANCGVYYVLWKKITTTSTKELMHCETLLLGLVKPMTALQDYNRITSSSQAIKNKNGVVARR